MENEHHQPEEEELSQTDIESMREMIDFWRGTKRWAKLIFAVGGFIGAVITAASWIVNHVTFTVTK